LLKRDKVNLAIFWLKDEALDESANLPAPEISDDFSRWNNSEQLLKI
jgi:hypothetical protein